MFRLVLLLMMLLALMIPVMAQDEPSVFVTNTPGEYLVTTPVVTSDDGIPADIVRELYQTALDQFSYVIVIVVGIGAIVLVVILLPGVYYLYQSAPPAFRPVVQQGALGVMTTIENQLKQRYDAAKGSGVDWDDDIWLALYNEAKKNREKIAALHDDGAVG